MRSRIVWLGLLGLLCLIAASGCAPKNVQFSSSHELKDPGQLFVCNPDKKYNLEVRALAYTSRSRKGSKKGAVPMSACGEPLTPGIKAVAVSPDLLTRGLAMRTKIKIQGMDGEYEVLDTMSPRWNKTIDIYFGDDVLGARQWGSKDIVISWD